MSADDLVIGRDGIGDPDPPHPAQVATAAAFLRLLTPTRSATWQSPDSYGLKHDAERWGRRNGLEPYVSNGALIAAAVALGYPIWHRGRGSPNAAIGVSKRDLSRLRAEAAVDQKVEQIREFVRWWDEGVRKRGRPSGNSAGSSRIPEPDAEQLTGISNQQVSRWHPPTTRRVSPTPTARLMLQRLPVREVSPPSQVSPPLRRGNGGDTRRAVFASLPESRRDTTATLGDTGETRLERLNA